MMNLMNTADYANMAVMLLASGVNNLFPTGVMNHFLSETHSQF